MSGRRASGPVKQQGQRLCGKNVLGILEGQVKERGGNYGWKDEMSDNGRPLGPHLVKARVYAGGIRSHGMV